MGANSLPLFLNVARLRRDKISVWSTLIKVCGTAYASQDQDIELRLRNPCLKAEIERKIGWRNRVSNDWEKKKKKSEKSSAEGLGMTRSSPQGLTSPATNSSRATISTISSDETRACDVSLSLGCSGVSKTEASQRLYPSILPSQTHAQPIKRLTINKLTVDKVPPFPSLPLQFIDQQQLRRSSGSDLRRAVRSHARRDVDVKRKQVQAALKARAPRLLLEKGDTERQVVPVKSRKQGAEATISASLVDHRRLPGVVSKRLIEFSVEGTAESSSNQETSNPAKSQTCSQLSEGDHSSISSPNWAIQKDNSRYDEGGYLWGHRRDAGYDSTRSQSSHDSDDLRDSEHSSLSWHIQKPHPHTSNDANLFNTLVRGSWRSDPSDIHGDLNSPRISFLLSHYNGILDTVWVSGHNLLSFQTSRPGLLHATMLFTASHLRVLTGSKEYDRDILHHQGETIRLVNSSLDDPFEQTSDQMIAALSTLILYEESYGSKHIASVHRQGLQQILKLRYSEPDLGIHRFVQHILAHPSPVSDTPHQIHQETTNLDSGVQHISSQQPAIKPLNTPLGNALTTFFQWLTTAAAQYETASYRNSNTNQVRQNIEQYLLQSPYYLKENLLFGFRSWLLASMVYLHVAIVPPSSITSLPRNQEEILDQLKHAFYNDSVPKSTYSPRLWVLMLNGLYERSSDPVLIGSPGILDFKTVQGLHWCRAQLLLRDIPWAERRWKLEEPDREGEDWGWVRGDGMRRWSESVDLWS